ncbi:LysR family transcriptional regulator [Acinetobacter schindleri]|uniref:LysR family transcriptional regulator n=1 Tax=Acinetobacter schindleri TaxID=108981 RepID=UPI00161E41F8|nr:LysR family transcriptional regulator [Acinetobacter schindleri]MBB4835230.1 DNA-binding transcriptional LysR family regulator [Acinetobacter schindleri]MDP1444407.1 LysR family transcriptional regulator [Acinetobacter schindleri]WBX38155.1 LysR family transcriptional regulator [Acinetobacter schindleri]
MRLDLFDLKLFLNIAETGSLTRGAEYSSISLQAASERIKKLEQHYQVKLFIRHSGGVKLTFAGQVFAEHAQAILQQGQQLSRAMAVFSEGQHSNISLWCNSSAQSEYLPLLLPKYLVNNPNIQIDLKEAESNDIIAALTSGTAKLGLISSFFATPQLQTLEFADDPLVLICPEQHDLSTSKALKLADCLNYPFVGLMQYHSLQQSIETQARLLHCEIQYRLRLPNFSAIAQVVANGVGIAIMPQRAAQRLAKLYAFKQIQLTGDWANRKLLLAAKNFNELSAAYQHFSQFLLSAEIQKVLD